MKQVKGTMLKYNVKVIRADKTGRYDKVLSVKAKELVAQRVMDPVWYPFDIYKEIFDANCLVDAKKDPRVIIQWGRMRGESLFSTIYQHSVTDISVKTALFSFSRLHKTLFNFGEVEGNILSDHEVEVVYRDFESNWDNFYYITAGWAQKFFELCIGKKVQYHILKDTAPGVNATHIRLTWTA